MYAHTTDFVEFVSDSIRGNWPRVSQMLQARYPQFKNSHLSEIEGDVTALREALLNLCNMSADVAENEISKFAHKADYFALDSEMLRSLQLYWSDLTATDIGQIDNRRSNLVSLLTRRYALSRIHAWQQANSFFARKIIISNA